MAIPFLTPDLPAWDVVKGELEQTYKAGRFHPGPFVDRFERAVEQALEVKHAVMVSTASDGLILLAAWARDTFGLCRGRNRQFVIGPDFTFRATPQAAWWAGLEYVPTDVGSDANLDPMALDRCIRAERGAYPAAIFAVHCFGKACEGIDAVAEDAAAPVFYDAAHALGARTESGKRVGSAGKAECFSLNITKTVPSCGEGGVITTNDDHLSEWLIKARWHGDTPGSLDWLTPGMNAKPTEWQAIVAYHALQNMDTVIAQRAALAREYTRRLPCGFVPLQFVGPKAVHAYKDYAVLAESMDVRVGACIRLDRAEIGYKRYFHPLVSGMDAVAGRYTAGRTAKDISERVICLPMSSRLSVEQQDAVLAALGG